MLGTPARIATVIGGAVAAAALHVGCVVLLAVHAPSRTAALYLAVRTAIAFTMTWANPFAAVFALAGYFDSERYARGPLLWTVYGATVVAMAGSQSGGFPPQGPLGWGMFAGLIMLHVAILAMVMRMTHVEDRRAAERERTIVELEQTNARLEEALAENAALQAQLVDQAREAGVHAERERLAAEIHDTLAQSLTGIITQLQAARDGDETRHDRALVLAREALDEARRSVRALTPAPLADSSLVPALESIVTRWSEHTIVKVDFVATDEIPQLSAAAQSAALRIVQEGLANVAQHADAERVRVTVAAVGEDVVIDVRDDGVGFLVGEEPERPGRGYGLAGMLRRAEGVGGTLAIESAPGEGTALSFRIRGRRS
ncbi:sensor histidine kinase [Aeromicrobium camelliae]|uniref:Sensor histidine kinase n=2 Tax=Aeromicrobium camelliae TaxID=1538144 RepID=A0A3N6WUY2_9ACTN|nr:sensor histidine kinase [Aeromicrobium camelliae]